MDLYEEERHTEIIRAALFPQINLSLLQVRIDLIGIITLGKGHEENKGIMVGLPSTSLTQWT